MIILESDYAYKAVEGTCMYDSFPKTNLTVTGYTAVIRSNTD